MAARTIASPARVVGFAAPTVDVAAAGGLLEDQPGDAGPAWRDDDHRGRPG
jgi:hypothetical protein